nr:MAG TPA: hypothetical protein [Caudoviricetes sp.]
MAANGYQNFIKISYQNPLGVWSRQVGQMVVLLPGSNQRYLRVL